MRGQAGVERMRELDVDMNPIAVARSLLRHLIIRQEGMIG
jgi:hypothetical protein